MYSPAWCILITCRIVSEISEVLEGKETVSVEDLEQLQYTEQVVQI